MAEDFLVDLVCFAFLSSSVHSSFRIVLIVAGVCLQEWQSSVSGGGYYNIQIYTKQSETIGITYVTVVDSQPLKGF